MENYEDDPTLTVGEKADLCKLETSGNGGSDSDGYSDTEGSSEEPTTCLEWKTNYRQEYVRDFASLGDGLRATNGMGSPGHWEQIPTGQTCVRRG
jgi:hypothetical protein